MKRNWISVAILLATLSMINASPFHVYKRDAPFHIYKRAVEFGKCKVPSEIVLTVKAIDPDPKAKDVAKTTLSFTTAKEHAKLLLTTTITEEGEGKAPKATTSNLCDSGLKCPVAKGKQVFIEAKTLVPEGIKAPFSIEYNVNDGETTVACASGSAKAAEGGGGGGDAPPPPPPEGGGGGGDAPPPPPPEGGGGGGGDDPPEGGGGGGGDDPPEGGGGGGGGGDDPPEGGGGGGGGDDPPEGGGGGGGGGGDDPPEGGGGGGGTR